MASVNISEIKDSLRELYLADERPWLVGFSGAKDSEGLLECLKAVISEWSLVNNHLDTSLVSEFV